MPKILIVKINSQLAKSAHRVLTNAGYDAKIATTGEESIGHFAERHILRCFVRRHRLDAPDKRNELAQEAAKLKPAIKILFSSGFSEAALVASGKAVVETGYRQGHRREDLIARSEPHEESGIMSGGYGIAAKSALGERRYHPNGNPLPGNHPFRARNLHCLGVGRAAEKALERLGKAWLLPDLRANHELIQHTCRYRWGKWSPGLR